MVLNAVHAPDPARLQAQLGQFRDGISATFTRVMAGLRDHRRIDGLSGGASVTP